MSDLQEWGCVTDAADKAKATFWKTIRLGLALGCIVLIVVTAFVRITV